MKQQMPIELQLIGVANLPIENRSVRTRSVIPQSGC